MERVVTIGFDIAKSVFQVHGIDATGAVVVRRKLARGRVLTFFEALPRCLIGMEACNTSYYWARELIALGHDVRLMPALLAWPCRPQLPLRAGCSDARARIRPAYPRQRGLRRWGRRLEIFLALPRPTACVSAQQKCLRRGR